MLLKSDLRSKLFQIISIGTGAQLGAEQQSFGPTYLDTNATDRAGKSVESIGVLLVGRNGLTAHARVEVGRNVRLEGPVQEGGDAPTMWTPGTSIDLSKGTAEIPFGQVAHVTELLDAVARAHDIDIRS